MIASRSCPRSGAARGLVSVAPLIRKGPRSVSRLAVGPLMCCAAGSPGQVQGDFDVLPDIERWQEVERLKHESDVPEAEGRALSLPKAVDILAEQKNPS